MRRGLSTRWKQAGSAAALALATLATLATLAGCGLIGRAGNRILNGPASAHEVVPRPEAIMDFHSLYSANCSACHGEQGKDGPSVAMNNPLYLAVATDDTLRNDITNGGPGGLMPAFGTSAGGELTDEQVNVIVKGIRQRWAKPAMFTGMTLPPYAAAHPGDSGAGAQVYAQACARCHGEVQPDGSMPKPGRSGSVVSPTYLSLISDQGLRTIVVAGRTDLGMPDFRNDIKGQPLSDAQITDVVAWLGSHRPQDVQENANGNQGSGQPAGAVKAGAAQVTNGEAAIAAQHPGANDQGRTPAPPKKETNKKAEKKAGIIRGTGGL